MSGATPKSGGIKPPEREGTARAWPETEFRRLKLGEWSAPAASRDMVHFHHFAMMDAGGLSLDPVEVYWHINDLSGRDAPARYVSREPLFDYGRVADRSRGSRSFISVDREIWDEGLFDFLRGVSATDPSVDPPAVWWAVADRHAIVDPRDPAGSALIDVVMFGIHGGTGSLRFRSVPGRRPFLHFSTTPDPGVIAVAERIRADDESPFSAIEGEELPRV